MGPRPEPWHPDFEDRQHDKPLDLSWLIPDDWEPPLPDAPRRTRQTLRAILFDALLEAQASDRCISYSRNKNHYPKGARRYYGKLFAYSQVMAAVELGARTGLIEHHKAPNYGPSGVQSILRATELARTTIALPRKEYQRGRTEEIRLKKDGVLSNYIDTERTDRMRRQIRKINASLAKTKITVGPNAPGVTTFDSIVEIWREKQTGKTTFTRLDMRLRQLHRPFLDDWTHGGRLYGHWVQNCPKEIRPHLLINGEATIELDFAALHPCFSFADAGCVLAEGQDPYLIHRREGPIQWDRAIAKRAFNIMLNAPNRRKAEGAIAAKCFASPSDNNPQASARQLMRDIKAAHPGLGHLWHTGIGTHYQYRDSKMMVLILLDLLKANIQGIPIHDSVIVQRKHEALVRKVMEDSARQEGVLNPVIRSTQLPEKRLTNGGAGGAALPPCLLPPSPRVLPLFR